MRKGEASGEDASQPKVSQNIGEIPQVDEGLKGEHALGTNKIPKYIDVWKTDERYE